MRDYLGEKSKESKRLWMMVFIFLFAFLGLVCLLLGTLSNDHIHKFYLDSADWHFLASVIFSIIASLVASYIFVFTSSDASRQLSIIRNVTHPEAINDFLNQAAHYNGIYCEDYNIDVTLRRLQGQSDVLLCHVKYSYKKTITGNKLKFLIIRDLEKKTSQPASVPTSAVLTYESYIKLDASAIPNQPASLYEFKNGMINNDHQLEFIPGPNNSDTFLEFLCDVPESVQREVSTPLIYEVCFPLQTESTLDLRFETFTHRGSISVNYSDVKDLIYFYHSEFISHQKDIFRDDTSSEERLAVGYNGWITPRSGIAIYWWKK